MSTDAKMLDALKGQPKQVWITAFAAVIAFMGIGLVDPILLSIAKGLHASPSQVTLLFSSYLGVQVVAMLVTGAASARFGAKRTVLTGLALIVIATALCASAGSIGQLVGLRAVWGLGNAFFIATALSVIVGAATGGQAGAILLYEAALGVGLAVGPLLGALLGSISWRGPFVGTAVLMAAALVLCSVFLARDAHEKRPRIRLCRWLGGAAAATLVGHIAGWLGSPQAPFLVAAVLCAIAGALLSRRPRSVDAHELPQEAVLVGEEF